MSSRSRVWTRPTSVAYPCCSRESPGDAPSLPGFRAVTAGIEASASATALSPRRRPAEGYSCVQRHALLKNRREEAGRRPACSPQNAQGRDQKVNPSGTDPLTSRALKRVLLVLMLELGPIASVMLRWSIYMFFLIIPLQGVGPSPATSLPQSSTPPIAHLAIIKALLSPELY
ncbi:uncharacterized protein BDZ99DRAFT_477171 [Mytilinidion resinicola]|uniref:Uncharacterized protein n=1 Tax=Mytilinidion resinicola TaxID=574789 RepID=A0A6A6YPL2_9PEZI|nr:uncharacterized protein BDZ99DRAFT_477171 [Mytilinidion resinicola]KAF2809807.1 hypothetical protein BDZ99DRAFT_477171 [Mytilinidion resinicola]